MKADAAVRERMAGPVLPGFEHVNRYWDPHRGMHAAKILPGEYYVTRLDELVVTVLGSCVSACIRDPQAGVGGMNHFLLPERDGEEASDSCANAWNAATRYGNYAMEHMINDILKHGGIRERLEVKIFGGGRIISRMGCIGSHNIAFIRDYLAVEGLPVVAEDVGGVYPRKVVYSPMTGKVSVLKLKSMHNDTITRREQDFLRNVSRQEVGGDVELFNKG